MAREVAVRPEDILREVSDSRTIRFIWTDDDRPDLMAARLWRMVKLAG